MTSCRVIFCLLLIVTIINSSQTKCEKKCPKNSTLKDSGYDCNNCVIRQSGALVKCALVQEKKCYCNEGYIRLAPGKNECITLEECDKYCKKNEILKECDEPCEPTCADPERKPCPTKRCIPGCDCKPDYIRDDKTNKCILKTECTKQ